MSNEKLSWKQIRERFDGKWVLLPEFGWPEGQPYPDWGVVHIHAPTRKEFNRLVLSDVASLPADTARFFVGDVTRSRRVRSNGVRAA